MREVLEGWRMDMKDSRKSEEVEWDLGCKLSLPIGAYFQLMHPRFFALREIMGIVGEAFGDAQDQE